MALCKLLPCSAPETGSDDSPTPLEAWAAPPSHQDRRKAVLGGVPALAVAPLTHKHCQVLPGTIRTCEDPKDLWLSLEGQRGA